MSVRTADQAREPPAGRCPAFEDYARRPIRVAAGSGCSHAADGHRNGGAADAGGATIAKAGRAGIRLATSSRRYYRMPRPMPMALGSPPY